MKTASLAIGSPLDLAEASILLCEFYKEHGPCELSVFAKAEKRRTLPQNAALHKYCATMAERMNDAGQTQRQLVGSFKEGFELPVTMHMIKDIFREVGNAMYQKESTSKLSTVEMQEVYRVVDMRFGEITGVRSEWPTSESMYYAGAKE